MGISDRLSGRSDYRRGLWLGLVLGALTAFPAGVALKAAGYPSDELYAWWVLVGVVYIAVLVAAASIALRRRHVALGLVIGTSAAIALAPLLVVLDIGVHSE